jgi:hypothetical protein
MAYTDVDGVRVYEYVLKPTTYVIHEVHNIISVGELVTVKVTYGMFTEGEELKICKRMSWQPLSDLTWTENGDQYVNQALINWLKQNMISDKLRRLLLASGVNVYELYA